MKSVQILISDTHFGMKNNSQVWLESQFNFINKEFLPLLINLKNNYDNVTVIHCGDLFDSRSSINPMIYNKVDNFIKDVCNIVDEMVIIGGNHDYVYQQEQDNNINSIEMLHCPHNCKIVTNEEYYVKDLQVGFIPWFEFNNYSKFKKSLLELPHNIVFTHTDLQHLSEEHKDLIDELGSSYNFVSGHIHTPWFKDNKYNLGICWAKDFSDANSQRGIYLIENWRINTLKFIENTESIKFYRLYNEEILDYKKYNIRPFDKVEVYIDKSLHTQSKYEESIKELNEYCDCKKFITSSDENITENINTDDWNILDMIENTIPDYLKRKFKKIVNEL